MSTDEMNTVEETGPESEGGESESEDRSEAPGITLMLSDLRGQAFERALVGAGKVAMQDSSADLEIDGHAASGGEATPAAVPPVEGKPGQQAKESISLIGPSLEMLRSLGVLCPAEVDRICAEDIGTRFLVEGFLPVKSIAIAAGESTIGKSPLGRP